MTVQVSDQLIFEEKKYDICRVEGTELFNPKEIGLKPIVMNTACVKGYICIYTVEKKYLQLLELGVYEEYAVRLKVKYGKGKEILGQKPKLHEFWECPYYENLDHKVEFTGQLLIGKDFIRDLPIVRSLKKPHRYKKVYELFFDSGDFFNIVDCSEKFADLREREIEEQEREKILVNNNPPQKVLVDELGWVTCPNCLIRFATYDKSRYSWDGERHIGCQQLLILVYK